MKLRHGITLCSLPTTQAGAASGDTPNVDVVLIGGGTMSATLGTLLQSLQPDWSIQLFERLDRAAEESSNVWNNAGTGHSAFAEMNYTSPQPDGSVDIQRAIGITEQFEVSRQYWASQVRDGVLSEPRSFINTVPHLSFVWGQDRVSFLNARFEAMHRNPLYAGMEYAEDPAKIAEWIPLVMSGREGSDPVAATRMPIGTEVNYGELTRQMMDSLAQRDNFELSLNTQVRDLKRNADGSWKVTVAKPATAATSAASTRASCSSAPAVRRCRCCRSRVSPRPSSTRASRWAGSSSTPPTRKWSPSTTPRSTAWRRPARRRCRAAHRQAHSRWHPGDHVRPLRHLLEQVSQERLVDRSDALDHPQ